MADHLALAKETPLIWVHYESGLFTEEWKLKQDYYVHDVIDHHFYPFPSWILIHDTLFVARDGNRWTRISIARDIAIALFKLFWLTWLPYTSHPSPFSPSLGLVFRLLGPPEVLPKAPWIWVSPVRVGGRPSPRFRKGCD